MPSHRLATTAHVTNTCVPCTGNAACMGRAGTEVCGGGECVECVAGAETACTSGVCNLRTNSCTTTAMGSAVVCEPCVNDRQCQAGQICAPMLFPALAGTMVGDYCAWRRDAPEGPMGDCTRVAVRPYVRALDVTSLNGVATMACVPRTSSCEALADYNSSLITCTASGATPDPLCGADGFDDGFCSGGRCTVECTTTDDCPCTGVTCARQYRCRGSLCEFGCECPTAGGPCVGTCP